MFSKFFLVKQVVDGFRRGVHKGHVHLAAEPVQRPLQILLHQVVFAGVILIKGGAVDQCRTAELLYRDLLKGGFGQAGKQGLVDLFQRLDHPQIGGLHGRSSVLFLR